MAIWNNASTVMYNGSTVDSVMYNGSVIWSPVPPIVLDSASGNLRLKVTDPEATKLAYTITDSRGLVVQSSDYTTSTADITAEGVAPFSIQMSGSSAPYYEYTLPTASTVYGMSGLAKSFTEYSHSAAGTQWTATANIGSSFRMSAAETDKLAYVSASAQKVTINGAIGCVYATVTKARYHGNVWTPFDPLGYLAEERSGVTGGTSISSRGPAYPSAFVAVGDFVKSMTLQSNLSVSSYARYATNLYLASGDLDNGHNWGLYDIDTLSLVSGQIVTSNQKVSLGGTFDINPASGFAVNLVKSGSQNFDSLGKTLYATAVIK